eukprot:179299-Rhodomonas_salina.1
MMWEGEDHGRRSSVQLCNRMPTLTWQDTKHMRPCNRERMKRAGGPEAPFCLMFELRKFLLCLLLLQSALPPPAVSASEQTRRWCDEED